MIGTGCGYVQIYAAAEQGRRSERRSAAKPEMKSSDSVEYKHECRGRNAGNSKLQRYGIAYATNQVERSILFGRSNEQKESILPSTDIPSLTDYTLEGVSYRKTTCERGRKGEEFKHRHASF